MTTTTNGLVETTLHVCDECAPVREPGQRVGRGFDLGPLFHPRHHQLAAEQGKGDRFQNQEERNDHRNGRRRDGVGIAVGKRAQNDNHGQNSCP